MIKSTYWHHPCRIRGKRFPSIAAAARSADLPYATMYTRLARGDAGHTLLPYDGCLPTSIAIVSMPPHIYAEGRWYYTQRDAAAELGVSETTIRNRIADTRRHDYWVHIPQ